MDDDGGGADTTEADHKGSASPSPTTSPSTKRDEVRPPRPKKPKAESRLAAVVRRWLATVLPTLAGLPLAAGSSLHEWSVETLVAQAPKRWVVYEPMVLLPTGSFSFQAAAAPGSPASPRNLPLWQSVLAAVSRDQQDQLWRDILLALSPKGGGSSAQLTHLAVNEGIPLHVDGGSAGDDENILRVPTGLRPLYGDFGPESIEGDSGPSEADFARAFWVSTKQNGLYQTWAPRWSMFSRGNIKEKARLLAWRDSQTPIPPSPSATTRPWAVDLYAGIGYFVFSYAQRGLRVLGWELNPWSADALRRGAARNGWLVRVVRGAADLARQTADVVSASEGGGEDPPRIIIFVEDNQNAARRLAELRAAETSTLTSSPRDREALQVEHVNCGLLPTSRATWRMAWDAVVGGSSSSRNTPRTGWLHLHENVGVEELRSRKEEIQAVVDAWADSTTATATTTTAVVEHVELVKTFAPGVWHCVFDVRITVG